LFTLVGVPAMYVLFGATHEAELDLEERVVRGVSREEMVEVMAKT